MALFIMFAITLSLYALKLLFTAAYMAVFLLVAVELVLKIKIRYIAAYKIALVGVILFSLPIFVTTIPYYTALFWNANHVFPMFDGQPALASLAFSVITTGSGFLLCAAAYGRLVKRPETQAPIGFLDGMKVAVVQFLILYIASMIFLDVRYFLPEGPHLWL